MKLANINSPTQQNALDEYCFQHNLELFGIEGSCEFSGLRNVLTQCLKRVEERGASEFALGEIDSRYSIYDDKVRSNFIIWGFLPKKDSV